MNIRCFFAVAVVFIAPPLVHAQANEPIAKRYTENDAMIPMRDGVKLYTTIYAPKEHKGPLPFILLRTPYGIESRGPRVAARST